MERELRDRNEKHASVVQTGLLLEARKSFFTLLAALLLCVVSSPQSALKGATNEASQSGAGASQPKGTDPAAPCPPLWVHVGDHIRALAFSPDGQWLATSAQDNWLAPTAKPNHITIWNAMSGNPERTWDMTQPVTQLVFSPGGDNLASIDQRGTVEVWDFRKGTRVYAAHGGRLTYSPDGKIWAAGGFQRVAAQPSQHGRDCDPNCGNSTIEIHDAATGRLLRTIDAGSWVTINALTITPSGLVLAAGCEEGSDVCEGSIGIWNLESGTLVNTYPHGADAFSPDGQWKATVQVNGESGDVKIVNVSDGTVKWNLAGKAVVFSPDWSKVALTQSNTIALKSLADSDTQTVTAGGGPVAFSPDGRRLAAANYSSETHKAITCNSAHTAITTWSSTLKIWDVRTGHELLTLGVMPQ